MSLGKLSQEKLIKEALEKEFGDKFSFEFPVVYYENHDYVFHLNIDSSDLGRTFVGNPCIVFKNINKIVNPILDKHNIIYSKWSSSLQNPVVWEDNVAYLKTDSEEELSQALKKIIPYIKDYCVPFWEKYQNLQEVLTLIDDYSEQKLNQGIFQGVMGIMTRLTIAYVESSNYFSDKKEFYQKLIKEYSEKKPEQYLELYNAFTKLINTLENSVFEELKTAPNLNYLEEKRQIVRLDGFYGSKEAKHHIDWHAGHKNETNTYYFFKFFENQVIGRFSSQDPNFNVNDFLNENPDYVSKQKGKYKVSDKTVSLTFGEGKFAVTRTFTIVSPSLLLDENLKEYSFIGNTENNTVV